MTCKGDMFFILIGRLRKREILYKGGDSLFDVQNILN